MQYAHAYEHISVLENVKVWSGKMWRILVILSSPFCKYLYACEHVLLFCSGLLMWLSFYVLLLKVFFLSIQVLLKQLSTIFASALIIESYNGNMGMDVDVPIIYISTEFIL